MGKGRDDSVNSKPVDNKKSKAEVNFLFDSKLEYSDELVKMWENMEFYKGETDQEYTVEGSIIGCNYGYSLTKLGIVKDHAIYDNNENAVLTCEDCVVGENVHDFGLCGSPILNRNSETAIIERGVPFATGQKIGGYKCKLQLTTGWQTGKIITHIWNSDKNIYEAALPQNGKLTCIYGGGVISILETNKTKSTVSELVLYTKKSPNLRDKAGGTKTIMAIEKDKLLIVSSSSWLNPTKAKGSDGVERKWIKVRYFNNTVEGNPDKWEWVDGWISKEFAEEVSNKIPVKKDLITKDEYLSEAEMIVNAKYIRKKLIDEYKWSKNAIYGSFGNIERESHFSPQFKERGTNKTGYGLTQWTPSTKLTDWASAEGLDYKDIDTQLKRIQFEVDNSGKQWVTSKHSANMDFKQYIKSTKSVEELTEIFLRCYEQAGVEVKEERILQAKRWEEVLELLS